jgi:CHAT domain-containing protein
VVFLPDRMLYAVPYAALRDTESGRYLAERHPISISPSASVFLKASTHPARLSQRPVGDLLIVGDPRPDPRLFPELVRLPGAGQEIAALRALFPRAELQTGAAATRARFLAVAGSHRIVHFAGHSVVNLDKPLRSCLVFAPDPSAGDPGPLYADDLLRQNLGSTGLVVLSACGTARGYSYDMEGTSAIARSFLAAGVPVVVASLWNVEDGAAARLFAEFYRVLPQEADAVSALRAAQLKLLSTGAPPVDWAVFEVIGG